MTKYGISKVTSVLCKICGKALSNVDEIEVHVQEHLDNHFPEAFFVISSTEMLVKLDKEDEEEEEEEPRPKKKVRKEEPEDDPVEDLRIKL